MPNIECKHCSCTMRKTKRSVHNRTAQVFAAALFIVGFILLFIFPIGTIVGVLIMIGASGMGYKRQKVWLCDNCKYFFERA